MAASAYVVLKLLLSACCSLGTYAVNAREKSPNSVFPRIEMFHKYIREHARSYQPGSKEFQRRWTIFQQRLIQIETHNKNSRRMWNATINKLSDRTPEELARLRGYKKHARSSEEGASLAHQQSGFLSRTVRTVDLSFLPEDWTWASRLQSMNLIRDQGECGSCWAFAATTVLRAHAELYQRDRSFSVQQVVSCTPNLRKCGGQGGCDGATAELAMDYVWKMGAATDEDLPYGARDSACPDQMQVPKPTIRSLLREQMNLAQQRTGTKLGMLGWKKLPENKVEPLLLAIYEQGPAVVSVMATEHWNQYGGGILDTCEREAVINHAVVLVGFGTVGGAKYWHIQNSWGPNWGEAGFIKLLRRNEESENAYCGWDHKPEMGTGCQGGPSEVYVCGSCGILYDSVVPQFQLSRDGWWAQNGRNFVSGASLLEVGESNRTSL
mmetsp:Transcript_115231/g.229561  ORF Transcript_115231/g.229561 Transcript_115231/m.229561 type:complete len:438 (+) Transcript_115231:68-1381(+)